MDARQLDCLVLWGWPAMWDFCTANARYLCPVGGNSELNVLVFPKNGDPTCFVLMPTFLDGWRAAQDWVTDIRARRGSSADLWSGVSPNLVSRLAASEWTVLPGRSIPTGGCRTASMSVSLS